MNALLSLLARSNPPAMNSSPDDRVVIADSSRSPGRSPILTQEDVAGQYAWTAVLMFETTAAVFCQSHAVCNPPSAKRHPPVAVRCDVWHGVSGNRCQVEES